MDWMLKVISIPWVTILTSIPLGAISSLIAWLILTYGIRPKISFGKNLSKLIDDNGKPYYRFKFENSGRRKIYGIEITVRFVFRCLNVKSNLEIIYIPVNNNILPIVKPIKKNNYHAHVPKIELSMIENKYFKYLPDYITQKLEQEELLLEDLLSLEKSKLIVIISGYDSISGSRRMFESKPYKLINIKNGKFKGLDVKGNLILDPNQN